MNSLLNYSGRRKIAENCRILNLSLGASPHVVRIEFTENPENYSAKCSQGKIEIYAHDVFTVKGLNFHELGHLLYTNRLPNLPGDLFVVHNILEDARVDFLMSTRSGVFQRYIEALRVQDAMKAMMHYHEDKSISSALYVICLYFIAYGAKFRHVLKLRRVIRKMDKKIVKLVRDGEKIVDSYIATDNSNVKEKRRLVVAMAELLAQISPKDAPNNNVVLNDVKEIERTPKKKVDIDDVREKLNKKIEEIGHIDEGEGEGEGENRGENENRGEDANKNEGEKEQGIQEVLDDLTETLDEIHENITIDERLGVTSISGWNPPPPGRTKFLQVEVDNKTMSMAQALERQMQLLRWGMRRGIEENVNRGRLDIKRVMKNQATQTLSAKVFKRMTSCWGGDMVYTAIVLDNSGSMLNAHLEGASRFIWSVRKAIGHGRWGDTLSLAFNDSVENFPWSPQNISYPISSGGTEVRNLCLPLQNFFNSAPSEAGKMLIFITDGEFSDPEFIACLRGLKARGVRVWILVLQKRPRCHGDSGDFVNNTQLLVELGVQVKYVRDAEGTQDILFCEFMKFLKDNQ